MTSHTKPEYSKRYAELNHDKIVEAKKLDYAANREKILARQKAWREANPEKQRAIAKAARAKYKDKFNAAQKAWRLANPEKVAASYEKRKATPQYKIRHLNDRLRKFGITGEDYAEMLKAQGGVCASCGTDRPSKKSSKRWSVDHCHNSKKVRGLLCSSCNLALGHVGDDVVKLQNLIDYLRRPLNGS